MGAHEADDDQKLNRAIAAEAENQRILAEQSASVARVVRAQWTGLPPGVIVQEGPLMQPVSPSVPVPDILQQHPICAGAGRRAPGDHLTPECPGSRVLPKVQPEARRDFLHKHYNLVSRSRIRWCVDGEIQRTWTEEYVCIQKG